MNGFEMYKKQKTKQDKKKTHLHVQSLQTWHFLFLNMQLCNVRELLHDSLRVRI